MKHLLMTTAGTLLLIVAGGTVLSAQEKAKGPPGTHDKYSLVSPSGTTPLVTHLAKFSMSGTTP